MFLSGRPGKFQEEVTFYVSHHKVGRNTVPFCSSLVAGAHSD